MVIARLDVRSDVVKLAERSTLRVSQVREILIGLADYWALTRLGKSRMVNRIRTKVSIKIRQVRIPLVQVQALRVRMS